MFALSKPKNKRAIDMASHTVSSCITGLKLLWFGNARVDTADLSDVLYESYVQGFLYAIAESNIKLFSHGYISKKDKESALLSIFASGFEVEEYDLSEWIAELEEKIAESADSEFKRGGINGIIMTNFLQNPEANHPDADIRGLLEKARSMPDSRGWLIAQLWFEELGRLKPAFLRRQNAVDQPAGSETSLAGTAQAVATEIA